MLPTRGWVVGLVCSGHCTASMHSGRVHSPLWRAVTYSSEMTGEDLLRIFTQASSSRDVGWMISCVCDFMCVCVCVCVSVCMHLSALKKVNGMSYQTKSVEIWSIAGSRHTLILMSKARRSRSQGYRVQTRWAWHGSACQCDCLRFLVWHWVIVLGLYPVF